jgi:predicted membrane protein
MKMNGSVLLGVFVVLVGVSILLQAVFHIHIPVFRTGFALFLIFLGARMLVHIWLPAPVKSSAETESVMQEAVFRPESTTGGALKYDAVFSKAVVDLTHLPRLESDLTVEINTIFGFTVVKVDPTFTYEVEGSAMFGSVQLPDGQQVSFGGVRRELPASRQEGPRLRLKLATVFGACQLQEAPAEASGSASARSTLSMGHPAR